MTVYAEAAKYFDYKVLAGHDNMFGIRAGRRTHRWDGLMIDTILHDAGINTVSFADASNALTVLTQQGKIRKPKNVRIGDVAFLAEDGYVGVVVDLPEKTHATVLVGWRPGVQGRRQAGRYALHRTIDVLAFADPSLPVKEAYAKRVLEPSDRKQIAELLAVHPAVDTYVASHDFNRAYARWQRYCGYGPDKADGRPDQRSLDRLGRETRA